MLNLKKLVLGVTLSVSAALAPVSAAVFVVAHPDDHILLMGPNLINDIVNGYPTVIIIVTAGDAGNGITDATPSGIQSGQYNNLGQQYYRVRLASHLNALESWIPAHTKTTYTNWTWQDEYIGNYAPSVERWFLGNVTVYHLNLPDSYDYQANQTELSKMRTGGIELRDIRGLNSYNVDSFKETIRQIVSRNNRNTPTLVINYPEYEEGGDHPDHREVGILVRQAITDSQPYGCMWQTLYPGYSMGSIGVNVSASLMEKQRLGYEIAHSTLLHNGNITPISDGAILPGDTSVPSHWARTTVHSGNLQKGTMDKFHTKFYGKSQFRGIASNGPCAF